MARYNHAFTIAFEVKTNYTKGHVPAGELLKALEARVRNLRRNPDELIEACGMPYDSFIEDRTPGNSVCPKCHTADIDICCDGPNGGCDVCCRCEECHPERIKRRKRTKKE